MSMSDSPTRGQALEHAEAAESEIDWEVVFDAQDLDYGHAGRMDIIRAVVLSGEKPAGVDEQDVFDEAVAGGDLERHDGGFHIAEHEPTPPEPEPEPSEESEGSTGFSSKKQLSGADDTVQVPRSYLQELEERAERNERRTEVVIQALGALTGADESGQIIVDELVEESRRYGKRFDHMSRTISRVSNQLDSLGELQEDKKPTKEGRIHMLRSHLAEKAHASNGKYAMDYNAVQSFFEGKGYDTSDSYASNLLSEAAEGHHAFFIQKRDGSNKKIAVDIEKIEDGSIFSVKKDSTGGAV
jgi:VCBS repeat-containing protein